MIGSGNRTVLASDTRPSFPLLESTLPWAQQLFYARKRRDEILPRLFTVITAMSGHFSDPHRGIVWQIMPGCDAFARRVVERIAACHGVYSEIKLSVVIYHHIQLSINKNKICRVRNELNGDKVRVRTVAVMTTRSFASFLWNIWSACYRN